jgi:hypothetical protein
VSESKAFLTIRVDAELKRELAQACEVEHRTISSFSRLLVEYAWGQYLKAGSIRELLSPREESRLVKE